MKKIFVLCALMLMWTVEVLAFGHTTIVSEKVSGGNATGYIPMVDGVNNAALQKNINSILKTAAENLRKEAGGQVTLSYQVTLNRPSMFSVVLKAVGNKTLYKGMSMDDTTGKEMDPKDLFYINDAFKQVVGNKEYVYGEEGLLCATGKMAPYTDLVPYSKLLQSINIAEGARFINSYKLTDASEGKALPMKTGELVALYLAANPTTGYNWNVGNGSSLPGYVSMGHSFFLPNNNRGMTGSPGTTIIFFSFDKPGSYTLALNYERAWEHNPINTKNFQFLVR